VKVYLAGPIFQCEDHECINWREEAKKSLGKFEVIDPMVRDYRGSTDRDFNEIVEKDKAEVNASDILLAYCTKPSVGTSMEVLYAWENRKKVYVITENNEISPWLLYHSHGIFKSVGEAVRYLNELSENPKVSL
jgi:nucleoside 2-deoxyribosyltransferase